MTYPAATQEGVLPFRSAEEIDRAIAPAVAHLRGRAGILAHPTETVYGLGGGIDAATVEALATLKPRSEEQPFLVLIADPAMLGTLGVTLTPAAAGLAARHWPGPLTLVLPARGRRGGAGAAAPSHRLYGGSGGIAVRWTSHAGLQRLIAAYGAPITSTSANPPGVPPARTAEEIVQLWGGALTSGLLRLLDAGTLRPSAASTVVDCTQPRPRVIRAGAVATTALRETVPDLIELP
jgi:L-threonylcarbamoyladenylate synthase